MVSLFNLIHLNVDSIQFQYKYWCFKICQLWKEFDSVKKSSSTEDNSLVIQLNSVKMYSHLIMSVPSNQ